MSSNEQSVYAIKPPDEVWLKMKQVYDVCTAAGIDPPREVSAFFNWERPDDSGVLIDLTGMKPHPCASEYSEEMRTGWEIDLSNVPAGTRALRFVHSYD